MRYPVKYETYHSSQWHEVSKEQYDNWAGMRRVTTNHTFRKTKKRRRWNPRQIIAEIVRFRGYR